MTVDEILTIDLKSDYCRFYSDLYFPKYLSPVVSAASDLSHKAKHCQHCAIKTVRELELATLQSPCVWRCEQLQVLPLSPAHDAAHDECEVSHCHVTVTRHITRDLSHIAGMWHRWLRGVMPQQGTYSVFLSFSGESFVQEYSMGVIQCSSFHIPSQIHFRAFYLPLLHISTNQKIQLL